MNIARDRAFGGKWFIAKKVAGRVGDIHRGVAYSDVGAGLNRRIHRRFVLDDLHLAHVQALRHHESTVMVDADVRPAGESGNIGRVD